MWRKPPLILLILCVTVHGGSFSDNSLVVSTTTAPKEASSSTDVDLNSQVNPQIYSMQIYANITNRFARTLITSKVRNIHRNASETTFSVLLPENAFISEFEMEIEGRIYKAYVKEKKEARRIYQDAVSRGQSAAHVELSARDSKTFTVSVNLEPEGKTIFRLVHEELLQRQTGQYELVINVNPGQTVGDLGVQVYINETRPLTFVRSPSLRTGNEVDKNDERLDPSADIEMINSISATVKFNPSVSQQKTFGELLGKNKENGLAGQFVVQYDVERDPQGGEVLVRDGYFVHFFAPSELKPLPKHVVFVLDHSASMTGTKFDQLVEAMQNILSELKSEDLFNIVRFSYFASVWNIESDSFSGMNLRSFTYGRLEPHLREMNLPQAVQATRKNVKKAKIAIKDHHDMGMTNIIAGLEVGLFLTKRTQENTPNKYQPMIIFLTDGDANEGMSSRHEITHIVTELNSGTNRTAIFSLSFGEDADKDFLKKLSLRNLGFSRHIYEAADATLQLQNFYRLISSPLLSNITFKYVDGVRDVTKTDYPLLFNGSELVVAGRTDDNPNVLLRVDGICGNGPVTFNASKTEAVTSLERLWAYLTVKQMLNERETANNKTELSKKALDLAIKYSFVTKVSSLVVVKPNQTTAVESKVAKSNSQSSPATFIPYMGKSRSRSSGSRSLFSAPASGWDNSYGTHFSSNIYAPPVNRLYESDFDSLVQSRRRNPGYYWTMKLTRPTTPRTSSNSSVPRWLFDLKSNNKNITTPQGTFILGPRTDVTTGPDCPRTPFNGTGVCTRIFDCPKIFSELKNITVYLQYFCPLKEYAGVCCPPLQQGS